MVTGNFLRPRKPFIQLRSNKLPRTCAKGPFEIQSEDDDTSETFVGQRPFQTQLGNWKFFPRTLAAPLGTARGEGALGTRFN